MQTKPTILLIEDNQSTRKMLKIALSIEGYHVIEAANGKEALERLSSAPDLILQDLMLPDIDGMDLIHKIHELTKDRDVPIIAISGFLNRIDETQLLRTEFTDFLMKPIEPSRLVEMIKTYLPISTPIQSVGEGQRILIADDDISQLKLLEFHLKQAGYTVETAIDGEEALQKVIANPPDAVISDVLMPHLDGFDLCMKIRENPKLASIPVILASSQYLEESDHQLAKKVGANDFVTRTEDYQALVKVLTDTLKNKFPAPPLAHHQLFKEEHVHSLIRQLERQVVTSSGLAQRSALQAAQLSLLRGVAEALTKRTDLDTTLQNVLTTCLDAAGINKGALYLVDRHTDVLSLKHRIGFTDQDKEDLEDFFGQHELLTEIMDRRHIVQIPSTDALLKRADDMLDRAGIKAALIIPLISINECLGVLFLGSKAAHFLEVDPAFAQTLGSHLAQTLALAETFKRLTTSEHRYRMLMESASCGILLYDENGIIVELNKQCEALFHCDKDHLLGRDFTDLIVPAEREFFSAKLSQLTSKNEGSFSEYHIKQANDEVRDVELSVVQIDIDNEKLFLNVINDVTERNRLRTQALLSDKLSTIGTMAAGIVHEINNPVAWMLANLNFMKDNLRILKFNIDQLQSTIKEKKDGQKIEYLQKFVNDLQKGLNKFDKILDESIHGDEQIRDIIKNLKEFTRIDDDHSITAVDVKNLLNAAIKISYPEIKYRARLKRHYASNIPLLQLNSGRLQQVFINLLINAAQAIPENKRKENVIRISVSLENDFVRIDISDTGVGIPKEALSKIFEPFYTTKPAGIGTGLGLTICREIINSLGGMIKVESEQGKGTTFTIYLPLKVSKMIPQKNKDKKKQHIDHVRILLVDDDIAILKTLKRMLQEQHQVVTALGGKEALEQLMKNDYHFDAIISDLNMPDLNGTDLYRYLAEAAPGLEQRIIYITGGMNTSNNIDFLNSISNLIIEKPFSKEDLLEAIDETLMGTNIS